MMCINFSSSIQTNPREIEAQKKQRMDGWDSQPATSATAAAMHSFQFLHGFYYYYGILIAGMV